MNGQRVLAAPDKFRGTATARQVAEAMAGAAESVGWRCDQAPVADGGEGLVDCFGGPTRSEPVTGPLGGTVHAPWRLSGTSAVLELAAASGLALTGGANDPMAATTTGVGELIRAAIEAGAQRVMVGAGGSAATDGGLGAIEVLRDLGPLDGTRGYRVVVATDVTTGFLAAAAEFGPQKGATAAQVVELAERLSRLADRYRSEFGVDVRDLAGAGAAGGFAGGLAALGAQLQPGFALVAHELGLAQRIARADLVLTGEGRFDASTLAGKAPAGVLELCRVAGVRAVVVAGARDPATVPPAGVTVISLAERFGPQRALQDTLACVFEVVSELLRRDAS